MTEDHGEEDVLSMYRTAPGNHARGHLNQRQIDTIREEVLPALAKRGYTDIGIITPYRDQVAAIQKQLGAGYDVATVHKFQGREVSSRCALLHHKKHRDFPAKCVPEPFRNKSHRILFSDILHRHCSIFHHAQFLFLSEDP